MLAARKTHSIIARARKKRRSARMLANARKDHSIPLAVLSLLSLRLKSPKPKRVYILPGLLIFYHSVLMSKNDLHSWINCKSVYKIISGHYGGCCIASRVAPILHLSEDEIKLWPIFTKNVIHVVTNGYIKANYSENVQNKQEIL